MIKGKRLYFGMRVLDFIEFPGEILKVIFTPGDNAVVQTANGEYVLRNYPDPYSMVYFKVKEVV